MRYTDPELLPLLAERYVLGVMGRLARRRFSRLLDEDPRIADSVYAVEKNLAPLAWDLNPVAPSELAWRRIATQAGLGARSADSAGLQRPRAAQPGRWPLLAVAASIAFVASSIGWWQSSTRPADVVVETVVETVTETVPVAVEPAIGVVANEGGDALWVARIYDDLERADISVSKLPEPRPNNDYQLWLLRDDGVPVSLGLLPQSGSRTVSLDAFAIDALGRGSTLAVSLEPLGGSPQPVPTGPVLYTAALLAP